MKKIEKQAVPIILIEDEPVAVIFYNKSRERIIYMLEKADEAEIISLIEDNENPS